MNFKKTVQYLDKDYLTLKRWNSYFKQLELVRSIAPESVLEIGPGNCVLSSVLRLHGIQTNSFDIDPNVPASWHGDVSKIASIVPTESFDCVLAFQILEHTPWVDIHDTLCEIRQITKRWAIISVPYSGILIMPMLRVGRRGLQEWRLCLRISGFWRSNKYYKQSGHHWECCAAGYKLGKVRNMITSVFRIVKEDFHPMDKSQIFWILEKRQ